MVSKLAAWACGIVRREAGKGKTCKHFSCVMHVQVFFDMSVGGSNAGRVVMELRADVVPKTAGQTTCSIWPNSSTAVLSVSSTTIAYSTLYDTLSCSIWPE